MMWWSTPEPGPRLARTRWVLDHENRKTPISKPAANDQRPNVQAEIMRMRLRRSWSCGISWDRSVIAARPLRWRPALENWQSFVTASVSSSQAPKTRQDHDPQTLSVGARLSSATRY